MKRKILAVTLFFIAVLSLFCGCNFINAGNLFPNDYTSIQNSSKIKRLETPTNVTFNDLNNTISWDAIPSADENTEYGVLLKTHNGRGFTQGVVFTKEPKYTLESDFYGHFTVKIYAKDLALETFESLYSKEYSFTKYRQLDFDQTSIKTSVNSNNLDISWANSLNADSYEIIIKVGETEVFKTTVAIKQVTFNGYENTKTYTILIKAISKNQYLLASDYASVTLSAEIDFANAEKVTIDKISELPLEINVENAKKVTISEKNVTLDCQITPTSVKIPFEIIETYETGNYELIIENDDGIRLFNLEIVDTRPPQIIVSPTNYVKHGGNYSVRIDKRENFVTDIKYNGSNLTRDVNYYFENDLIYFTSDFLDSLPNGQVTFELLYSTPFGNDDSVTFNITTVSRLAVLNNATYYYYGNNDVNVDIQTQGDAVISVSTTSTTLNKNTDYETDKNKLIIRNSFLHNNHDEFFTITTELGSSLLFSIVSQLDGFIPSQTTYTHVKNSENDLTIFGNVSNGNVYFYGNKITRNDYLINATETGVIISSDYLNDLPFGCYEFIAERDKDYHLFNIEITSSNDEIENLVLDDEVSGNRAIIHFDCPCGNNDHYYSLDGSPDAKVTDGLIVNNFDKTTTHTLIVKCKTNSKNKTFSYNPPPSDASTYANVFGSLQGEEFNYYVENIQEFKQMLTFVAYGGKGIVQDASNPNGYAEIIGYYSNEFVDYANLNPNYFSSATKSLEVPWACKFNLSSVGKTFTLKATFNNYPYSSSVSGQQKVDVEDTRVFLTNGNRPLNFNDFAINSCLATETITSVSELESLNLGVKPIFNDGSVEKAVYENALSICRQYISNDMSDYEKVKVFYHYLTSQITYDYNALKIYNLSSVINGYDSASINTFINQAITEYPSLSATLTPILSIPNASDKQTAIKSILSSLNSFNLQGAFIDNIAVCDGISSAFKLLCTIEGIPCLKVTGLGVSNDGSENHAWNKVLLNDKWRVVDATWGRNGNYISHEYFLIDDMTAKNTHIENPQVSNSKYYSVIDTLATGGFDYYAETKFTYLTNEFDLVVNSDSDFKTTLNNLKSLGETVIELKLDYAFTNVSNVISQCSISGKYYLNNNVVTIIINH